VAAAKKAFIVTRFADLGFLIGILTLGFYGESFDFQTLIQRFTDHQSPQFITISAASFLGITALSWGLMLVFMGGAGKSAMFPLHIWLPDAMEGPTPVSALIHAATMVVAGVYLVARLFPIFAISDQAALDVVAFIGILSALLAAIIACTQTDIKRVLAFSTMSQIGFMMFALGVSNYGSENGAGYSASLFHLFTHAFFKSLLFLGAGAIIHMVHSNNMEDMGGLRKHMPITHISFLIACLAISGIPPFAGFFSKEAILHAAHISSPIIYYLALFTSMLTAFYMFRLYFNIFWSSEAKPIHNSHGEGTWSMKIPLIVLGILSAVVGFVPFSHYVSSDGKPLTSHLDIMFSILPVSLATAGILLAAYLYKNKNEKPEQITQNLGLLFTIVKQKFYIDEIYLFITHKIIFNLIGRPAAWIDKTIVDGFYSLTATTTEEFASTIKGWQSGNLQSYALYFLGGILGLAILIIYALI
jgi:NADH-quinone oxidoreductase subunit L